TLLFIFTGKKIGLVERSYLSDSISAFSIGGILKVSKFFFKIVVIVESLGALILLPTFVHDFGVKGIWFSIFHSISAFCNAGFDLLGCRQPFSSLTMYADNPFVLLTISMLIVIGGIGFFTWEDISKHKLDFHAYRLQSKIILSTTALLILIPAIYFYVFEFNTLPGKQRILASIFQSITPRTAGFNSEDYSLMSESGQFLTICLMLIGGASGSTAGGIKVATFAILCSVTITIILRQEETNIFKRRIPNDIVNKCITILTLYIVLMIFSTMAIASIEGIPIIQAGFECASALGTVGLTLGITPELSSISHVILIALMYIGRVGGLTLLFATTNSKKRKSKYPLEKVSVG
ncbi:MAG: potassium transporter TrkG, partial [Bacillota bacterium]|nr:potassium transporter TrkG [Bacillota bacterium]